MEIYLLYSCNQHRDRSSFKLIMVSTDEQKIREELKFQIRNGFMYFTGDLSEIDNNSILYNLNHNLIYGYISVVQDGQRL